MGQRFQAHYIMKNREGKTYKMAFHLQWSWGHYSIIRLNQVLDYFKNNLSDKYCKFNGKGFEDYEEIKDVLHSLTSLNLVTKSFVNADYEDPNECDVTKNPLYGDNNDGIYIVDLRGEKPRYCMLHWVQNENLKPISAREYFNMYHEKDLQKLNSDIDPEGLRDINVAFSFLSNIETFELIKEEELRELYPKMYKEYEEEV